MPHAAVSTARHHFRVEWIPNWSVAMIDIPKILGGSVVAGFGLSAGRDLYRKTKKNLLMALIVICLIGIFFGGVWLARQYETALGAIFGRLGALVVLVGSFCTVQVSLIFLLVMFGASGPVAEMVTTQLTLYNMTSILASEVMMKPIEYMFDLLWHDAPNSENHFAMLVLFWVEAAQVLLFLLGAVIGSFQRDSYGATTT